MNSTIAWTVQWHVQYNNMNSTIAWTAQYHGQYNSMNSTITWTVQYHEQKNWIKVESTSGVYRIYPDNSDGIDVYCNMDIDILLWSESLYSDGHQFHKYQQNEQSPLLLSTEYMDIQVLVWDRHTHVVSWIG